MMSHGTLLRVNAEDFPLPAISGPDRATMTTVRPDLRDRLRTGSLRVLWEQTGDTDAETGRTPGRAWIELCEHTDPLHPESTVTRVHPCDSDDDADIVAALASMRDTGAAPAYLVASAITDLTRGL